MSDDLKQKAARFAIVAHQLTLRLTMLEGMDPSDPRLSGPAATPVSTAIDRVGYEAGKASAFIDVMLGTEAVMDEMSLLLQSPRG